MKYLIKQNMLVKFLAKETLSEKRLNVYFIFYVFIFITYIAFINKESSRNMYIILSEFIINSFILIVSYLINGDKNFMQRYIAINLSNMVIFIIPLFFIYILIFIYDINEKYDQIISITFEIIYSVLILYNFYKIKRVEKIILFK